MKVQYYPRFEIDREASSFVAPPLRQASPPSLLPFAGLLRRPHLRRPSPPRSAALSPAGRPSPPWSAAPSSAALPRRGPQLPRRPPFPPAACSATTSDPSLLATDPSPAASPHSNQELEVSRCAVHFCCSSPLQSRESAVDPKNRSIDVNLIN